MLSKEAKILVADDSRVIRMAVKRMLAELGYANVIEAADGAEAVKTYHSQKPDLIMLDIVMPNMNGDEALREIRIKDESTPVLMLSSVARESQIESCKALGITEFITKPITAQTGVERLQPILAHL